jgi:hypothetical protein
MNSIKYKDYNFRIVNVIEKTDSFQTLIVESPDYKNKYIFNAYNISELEYSMVNKIIENTHLAPLENQIKEDHFFFVSMNIIYICYKYNPGESIDCYLKRLPLNSTDLLTLFEDYLIEIIEKVTKDPSINNMYFVPNNIYITNDNTIKYNLFLLESADHGEDNILFPIHRTLTPFISYFDKKTKEQIQLIIDKSKNGLYYTINEILYDFKKIKHTKAITLITRIKLYFIRHKRFFSLAVKISLILLVLFFFRNTIFSYFENSNLSNFQRLGEYEVAENGETTYISKSSNISNYIPPEKVQKKLSLDALPTYSNTKEYIVQPGDTIRKISMTFYNSTAYSDAIADYNNIVNKDLIYIGQKIIIPNLK